MNIRRISAYQVDLPLHEGSYNWSGEKSVAVFDSTVVRVETDDGAVGFGDPVRHLGFSYCCNRMAPIADLGPFAPPMIDAMYAAL